MNEYQYEILDVNESNSEYDKIYFSYDNHIFQMVWMYNSWMMDVYIPDNNHYGWCYIGPHGQVDVKMSIQKAIQDYKLNIKENQLANYRLCQ